MVLHRKRCGRVGRRRIFSRSPPRKRRAFPFSGGVMARVMVGIIGGTGLGEALGALGSGQVHEVDTPFGRPSGPITTTDVGGVPVALLSRHGEGHLLNPSQVPYRANVFAL